MKFFSVFLKTIVILELSYLCYTKDFGKTNTVDSKDKYRVCIVENRGAYKKTTIHCPTLEAKSNIECVVGIDRLDCLRRIHKGSAHFGVFSSEDLVAARWAGVEILVTNELRFHDTPFEYEIVAIVDNEAGINTPYDLGGSRFCHPGHGLRGHWTDVLANYFESTLVPRLCENDLTLIESRLKASANFFGPSCKAGPWVPDTILDKNLKRKYPSLCELCDNPYQCSVSDKHWGRQGSLYCLTSGNGQVAWARLDDVKSHFGFSGLPPQANPADYSFLCIDGHLQPLTTKHPCVWVAKPWPAVASKRSTANQIQQLLQNLSHDNEESWQHALLSLLETYHVNVTSLDFAIPIDDYLDQAVGFQGAYSFPSCNPPRSIIYCTTSLIQHNKCSWLQEAASVYGVEPNVQCIRAESLDRCMDDTKHKFADIVMVNSDDRIRAVRQFNLKPILYEYSPKLEDRYKIVAVVKSKSNIKNFEELKNKIACFPSYEGAAYISAIETIRNLSLSNPECKYSTEIDEYFSKYSCTWNTNNQRDCNNDYKGDFGAMKCLVDGYGDVAFVEYDTYKNLSIKHKDLTLLCPFKNKIQKQNDPCYLQWLPRGSLMIHNETELMRRNEIYNSLREMDRLFGKHYKSQNVPFTLFGPFDKKNNVMFHDVTDSLKGSLELMKDRIPRNLETAYENYLTNTCKYLPNKAPNTSIGSNKFIITSIILSILSIIVNS